MISHEYVLSHIVVLIRCVISRYWKIKGHIPAKEGNEHSRVAFSHSVPRCVFSKASMYISKKNVEHPISRTLRISFSFFYITSGFSL